MRGFHIGEQPDEGVLAYHFKESLCEKIDDWAERSQAIQQAVQIEYNDKKWHVRILYLMHRIELSTPYAVRRTIRLLASRSQALRLSTAVVTPNLCFQIASQYISKRIPNADHVRHVKPIEDGIAGLNERQRAYS